MRGGRLPGEFGEDSGAQRGVDVFGLAGGGGEGLSVIVQVSERGPG